MRESIDQFVHRSNVKILNEQLCRAVDDTQRKMLSRLLAQEALKTIDVGERSGLSPRI